MEDSFSKSSLRSALMLPFQSKDWSNRFLIGVGLSLAGLIIPIIPSVFVSGYVVEVMRQAINGEVTELPEWKDWGKYGMDGLRSTVVGLVYMGPGILVSVLGWLAYMGIFIGGAAMSSVPSRGDISGPMFTLMMVAMTVLFLGMFLGTGLSMAGAIPLPAALAHFIARDELGAAFHIREVNRIIKGDKWGYFLGWLVLMGLMTVLYLIFMLLYLTVILCFLGYLIMIPFGFYFMLVGAVIFGRHYRESVAALEPPTEGMAVEAAASEPAE